VNGELGDQGLPRSGRRGDDDRIPLQDGPDRADLKVVQDERAAGLEAPEEVEVAVAQSPRAVGFLQLLGEDIGENLRLSFDSSLPRA